MRVLGAVFPAAAVQLQFYSAAEFRGTKAPCPVRWRLLLTAEHAFGFLLRYFAKDGFEEIQIPSPHVPSIGSGAPQISQSRLCPRLILGNCSNSWGSMFLDFWVSQERRSTACFWFSVGVLALRFAYLGCEVLCSANIYFRCDPWVETSGC